MRRRSTKIFCHVAYWVFVLLFLTVIFGRSWGNGIAAFYFIAMLLPIVLGTSYFFNYLLVPKFFLREAYFKFCLYTFYTVIVSLYLEAVVLMLSFVYLGNLSFTDLGIKASDTLLVALALYFLVLLGSLVVMAQQVRENREVISRLLRDKEMMRKPFLEIMSNRRVTKIPYDDIYYIESLSDHIQIHTRKELITSKEKISKLTNKLPETFLRIHRSFIVNKEKISSFSSSQVILNDVRLNIGRSYKQTVKMVLSKT